MLRTLGLKVMFAALALAGLASTSFAEPLPAEKLSEIYAESSAELLSCGPAAAKYCGKVSRSMSITEGEYACLRSYSFRQTRNAMPALDGTECNTKLRELDREYDEQAKRYSKSRADLFHENHSQLAKVCKSAAKDTCNADDVTLASFKCLWKESTRESREGNPFYDGTPCDRTVRQMAAKNSYGTRVAPSASEAVHVNPDGSLSDGLR